MEHFMKKTLVVLALLATTGSAYSASVIRFFGEVTDQACQILVNDNPTNPSVLLDPVPASQVAQAAVGEIIRIQEVNVRIFGCSTRPGAVGIRLVPNSLITDGTGTTALYFLQNYLIDNPTASLGNTVSKNVFLRLADKDDNPLSFQEGDARLYEIFPESGDENTNIDLKFKVGYAKRDTTTPELGLIQSNVQYAISYK